MDEGAGDACATIELSVLIQRGVGDLQEFHFDSGLLSFNFSSNLLLCEARVWRRGLLGSCTRDVGAILKHEVVVG